MTQLPELLAARGVPAQVHMVGDKIHSDPADPGYARRMRAALGTLQADPGRSAPAARLRTVRAPPGRRACGGVIWHGRPLAAGAMQLAASCDIGLSWRDASLDASLEAVHEGAGIRRPRAAGDPQPNPDARGHFLARIILCSPAT